MTSDIDATIWRFPHVLNPTECATIINAAQPYGTEVEPKNGGKLIAHPIDDVDDRIGADTTTKLWHLAAYMSHICGWNIPFDIGRAGVSNYRTGDSMAVHVDDEERTAAPWAWDLPHRGVSMSIPLTEGHRGGQLRLHTGGAGGWETPTAGRGDAIVFGASVPHEVTPVTEGDRWVLLFWAYTNHDYRGIC